ncbi:nitroreductase family deazaflavin-dependent oxidoreductase [Streptomyces morookaense]|uniref:Nitroreductase family deazaflavin-dependent oxidoreductase n=1 Tax=Streptomyces morookaense TaxID=1970 RepID=A0A7Y7B589_STRMO|nr:nitroreductase family deazaflavin-dependent oxidoreductase [Streptomyces morookaense]NVK78851.1 nitroreductase family deazaflavin-dependent oxidoreductase [Streptomyces morookaense]GHF35272.1 nitroreductase [Streptomyces morookaense]
MTQTTRYIKPGRFAARLNGGIGWLARRGISLAGAADLAVLGRKSGEWRRVPVNPLDFGGGQYLVSARGVSEWVRNMRAAGGGRLRVGRRVREFTAQEMAPAETTEILRAYLERWGWEVKNYFGDVTATSTDEELLAAAPLHPVFRITATS